MKIGIYVGNLDPNLGGESSLTKTILQEIKKNNNDYEFVFLYINESRSIKKSIIYEYEFINISKCCNNKSLLFNGIIDSLGGGSNRFFELDKIAQKENIDMFYFAAPIFAQTSLPYIFTVWDLGHRTTLYFPEVSEREWGYREKMYNKMLPRATFIITANNQGKNDIIKYYNIDENRIKIVPFPITYFCFKNEEKPSFVEEKDFFFYPAQFWSHKNHIVIIEALSILRDKYGLCPMVYFTGSDKGNKDYIQSKVDEYGLNNQIKLTGFIKDEELVYLYNHAKALVYASLLGPNNLPPQEALYLGCPIILSDIPGHKEQMGDSALYFDGYNPKDLAEKMRVLLQNDNYEKDKKTNCYEIGDNDYFSKIIVLFDNIKKIIYRWKSV